VANELGAGNGKGARFATIVSITLSLMIGLFFTVIIVIFHDQIGSIFSSSEAILNAVDNLSVLLAFTVLLNSVQPVLSGTPWNWFHKPGQRKCVDFWHLIKVLLLVRVGNRTWHILIWDVTTLSGFRLGLLWAGFSNLESRFAQFSSQQMSAYYYVGKLCFFDVHICGDELTYVYGW